VTLILNTYLNVAIGVFLASRIDHKSNLLGDEYLDLNTDHNGGPEFKGDNTVTWR